MKCCTTWLSYYSSMSDEDNNNSSTSSQPVIDSLNAALDELGMLSSVTNSRQQYLQERERFYGQLGALSMNDSEASQDLQTDNTMPGMQSSARPHLQAGMQGPTPDRQCHGAGLQSYQPVIQCPSAILQSDALVMKSPASLLQSSTSAVQQSYSVFRSPDSVIQPSSSLNQPPSSLIQPSSTMFQFPASLIQSSSSVIQPSASVFESQASTIQSHTPFVLPNVNFGMPCVLDIKGKEDTSGTEKENTIFSGFNVLAMNSKFITSFKSDYSLPPHVEGASKYQCSLSGTMDRFLHKNCKRNNMFRRKRLRTHPYENCSNSYQTFVQLYNRETTSLSSTNSNCYRLRTSSLSGGTCRGKVWKRVHKPHDSTPSGQCCAAPRVGRSRSMENLSAALDTASDATAAVLKTKDVENVSRAIQQLCVQDSG